MTYPSCPGDLHAIARTKRLAEAEQDRRNIVLDRVSNGKAQRQTQDTGSAENCAQQGGRPHYVEREDDTEHNEAKPNKLSQ